MQHVRTLAVVLIALFVNIEPAVAQATQPAKSFSLTRRQDRDYGTAAYSFRHQSQDIAVHRNYVDVVFNNCGLIHITPVNGMTSRIADLGATTLDAAPRDPEKVEHWNSRSIVPEAGHVYMLEITVDGERSLVKFRVDEQKDDSLSISWEPIDLTAPANTNRGKAGTMGKCGGKHDAK